jgi:hypothetical protein
MYDWNDAQKRGKCEEGESLTWSGKEGERGKAIGGSGE